MILLALSLDAFAQVPFPIALDTPNRVSILQPFGPASTGGAAGGIAQYTLYIEASPGRAYDAACFTHAWGTTTSTYELALLGMGTDGRPGALLWHSDPIALGTVGTSPVLHCAAFTDTDGTVVDAEALAGGVAALALGDGVWLGFYRASGTNGPTHHTANPSYALPLGQSYPGGPKVFHLQDSAHSGWSSDPVVTDVTNGQPVLVSLQVAQ